MKNALRYFELNGNTLVCGIGDDYTLPELEEYLTFDKKPLHATKFFQESYIFQISPKNIDDIQTSVIFGTFSDENSIQTLRILKELFISAEKDDESSMHNHRFIVIFLPVVKDPVKNLSILDLLFQSENEDQISEIINEEYYLSIDYERTLGEESSEFSKLSSLYFKFLSLPTNKRDEGLKRHPEFRDISNPFNRLYNEFLKIKFGSTTAALFSNIFTYPTFYSNNNIFSGIPRGNDLERFIDKLYRNKI